MLPLQTGFVGRLEQYATQKLIPQSIDFATDIVVFVATVVLVSFLGRWLVRPAVERVLRGRGIDETLVKPSLKLVKAGMVILGIGIGLAVAGFGNLLTAMATLAAAATLAIGFASKDLISNLVAGVFLIADPKIRIGDWVEWSDNAGVIEDISFRVSRVRTFNNELVTVPNSELANTAITNPVAKDKLRIPFVFGVGYEDDLDHAKEVIIEEAANHPEILEEPAPSVRVTELADSYVGLQSRFWIAEPDRADFMKTRSEFVQAVKERCDAEEIEMPYPYTELTGRIEVEGDEPAEA